MKKQVVAFSIFLLLGFLTSGCAKQKRSSINNQEHELSITIKNITQANIFVTCFAYIKKDNSPRWRWDKSPIYEMKSKSTITIPIATLKRKKDLEDVYGALGVFNEEKDADDAIYELLPDENKVDLDRIYNIKDKTVLLGVENYGRLHAGRIDYEFAGNLEEEANILHAEELDFYVENNMHRPVYVAGFIYQKKEDMPVWQFDKTPVIRIEPDEVGKIDVDTLTVDYDRKYMRAYLGVFRENEQVEAENSTYQLLKPYQKVNLGRIAELKDKKVSLKIEQYGILGNMIDFSIKKPRRIKFGK